MALKLEETRKLLKGIIRDVHALIAKADTTGTQSYAICDEATDTYCILIVGWDNTGRVLGPTLYFRIHEGKLWIEENQTDLEFIEERILAHIAKDDIVLGFVHPEEREYSDYAVA